MKRCKKTAHSAPRYPHVKAFLKRNTRRAGVGLLVGLVATTAGCDWLTDGVLNPKPGVDTGGEIDGMVAETAETYTLQLPADGSRDLYFSDPWGWIQYRVILVLDNAAFYDWLYQNAEEALASVDAVLGAEAVTAYEHDDGFDTVENEIARVLAAAYEEATGRTHASFMAVDLLVDSYEDEDDILGDQEAAR